MLGNLAHGYRSREKSTGPAPGATTLVRYCRHEPPALATPLGPRSLGVACAPVMVARAASLTAMRHGAGAVKGGRQKNELFFARRPGCR